jgi:hypothetical protein
LRAGGSASSPATPALELLLVARAACPEDLALRFGAGPRPVRVELPFDGLLSPAHLRAGDRLRSVHRLSRGELSAIERRGLYVGALRSSGARPEPTDPHVIAARLLRPTGE